MILFSSSKSGSIRSDPIHVPRHGWCSLPFAAALPPVIGRSAYPGSRPIERPIDNSFFASTRTKLSFKHCTPAPRGPQSGRRTIRDRSVLVFIGSLKAIFPQRAPRHAQKRQRVAYANCLFCGVCNESWEKSSVISSRLATNESRNNATLNHWVVGSIPTRCNACLRFNDLRRNVENV